MNQNETSTPTLESFKEAAIRAHNWTSFSPERRGESMIRDYSAELDADVEELRKVASVTEEAIQDYTARYKRFFASYLNAKSNCISSMITGGSNFPVRKAEKANRSERRHYEVFREWRDRAKKAIVRQSKPKTTYVTDLERYKADLVSMKKYHELMKEGNKVIAKAKKDGTDITEYLRSTFDIKQDNVLKHVMQFGFGLTNNNANMKRVQERIDLLEKKESHRQLDPEKEFTFNGGKVIMNYEIDRIQVFFDTRPTPNELTAWKAKGLSSFNWSPSNSAWQRKITGNAIYAVKRMVGELKSE